MIIKDVIVSGGNAKIVTECKSAILELGDIPEEKMELLTGMEFNSREDFLKLNDFFEHKSYKELESAILSCAQVPFLLLDSNARQIPRPMSLILKKHSGVIGFYAVSYSVDDFEKGLNANNKVIKLVEGRLRKYKTLNLPDELILDVIKECVDEVNIHIGFKVQIGIDCDSCLGSVDELVSLVEKYDLCYVEDPFPDLLSCKGATKRVKHRAFVCSSLDRENHEKFLRSGIYSCVLVSSESVKELAARIAFFRKSSVGLVCDSGLADVCVGFGIPVLKIGSGDVERVLEIKDWIRKLAKMKVEDISN